MEFTSRMNFRSIAEAIRRGRPLTRAVPGWRTTLPRSARFSCRPAFPPYGDGKPQVLLSSLVAEAGDPLIFVTPLSPPSAPVPGRLQSPPAKSKFLAVSCKKESVRKTIGFFRTDFWQTI